MRILMTTDVDRVHAETADGADPFHELELVGITAGALCHRAFEMGTPEGGPAHGDIGEQRNQLAARGQLGDDQRQADREPRADSHVGPVDGIEHESC